TQLQCRIASKITSAAGTEPVAYCSTAWRVTPSSSAMSSAVFPFFRASLIRRRKSCFILRLAAVRCFRGVAFFRALLPCHKVMLQVYLRQVYKFICNKCVRTEQRTADEVFAKKGGSTRMTAIGWES